MKHIIAILLASAVLLGGCSEPIAVGSPVESHAQHRDDDLPELTPDQRWARMESHRKGPIAVGTDATQAPCPVQGAWVMESQTVNGETQSLGQWRQLKILTDSHFAFVGQVSDPPIPQSEADSLEAYRTQGFGGGPYEVTDSTYTEHLEYFVDPRYVGRDVTFSCRVEGDRWHIAGELPVFEAGEETGSMQLEEVWRRVETARQADRDS